MHVEFTSVAVASLLLAAKAVVQSADPDVVLENDLLRIRIQSDGTLAEFSPSPFSDNYIKAMADKPGLFSITIGDRDGKNQTKATPVCVKATLQGTSLVVEAAQFEANGSVLAISAHLTIELTNDQPISRWTISLTNAEKEIVLYEVRLEAMSGVRIGEEWEDDALYCPYWGGERFPSAVQDFEDMAEGRIDSLEGGTERVFKQNDQYVRDLHYAGGCSMMWMDYVDRRAGLFLASYDPQFLVTLLRARTKGPSEGAMSFALGKWITVRSGETWTSAPFIIAAHGGDWHWAADQYRAWFDLVVKLGYAGGEWRERLGGWLTSMKGASGPATKTFAELPGLWQQVADAGMDTLIPYGWSHAGFDSLVPVYYPDLEVGGPMEMYRAYRAIRDAGGHIMTYTNGRIFNLRSVYYDALGSNWAVTNPDASKATEKYGAESFAVMCPGVEEWRSLMADFGEMLVRQYDTDLVYYDQIAAAPPKPCYSTEHGHGQIGMWNQQYLAFLKQAYDRSTGVNRDIAIMIEGCADIYTQYAVFQSYLGLNHAGNRFGFPEMYKYTFPEAIQASLIMFTETPQTAFNVGIQGPSRKVAEQWLCRELMMGNFLAYLDPLINDHPWWEQVQQLVALRKTAAQWMATGVYRDSADIVHATSGLDARTFRCDRMSPAAVLVGVYNEGSTSGGTVTVDCGNIAEPVARCLAPGGKSVDIPVQYDTNGFKIEVPEDLLFFAVIENAR